MEYGSMVSQYKPSATNGVTYNGVWPSLTNTAEVKKSKEYYLAWAQSMYVFRNNQANFWIGNGLTGLSSAGSNGLMQMWIENRSYVQGRQPANKYKQEFVVPSNNELGAETMMNVDWTPIPVLPKFLDILTSLISKRRSSIVAQVIDPLADEAKNQALNQMKAGIILQDIARELAELGVPVQEPDITNDDELNLFVLEGGLRLNQERMLEEGVDLVHTQSNWELIEKELIEDFLSTDMGVLWDDITPAGTIETTRFMPERCLFDYSEKWDWKDARFGGVFDIISEQDLRILANGELTDDEIKNSLNNTYVNQWYFWTGSGGMTAYQNRCCVLKFWFRDVEGKAYEKRTTKFGNDAVREKSPDFVPAEGKEKIQLEYPCYKQGYWVVGTPYVFGCRPVANQGRTRKKFGTLPPMQVFMPRNLFGTNLPMARRAIQYIDQLQLAWYQWQNALMKEPPPGLQINIGAIAQGISLGKGGAYDANTFQQVLRQTGNFYFNSVDPDTGEPIQGYPVSQTGVNFTPYLLQREQTMMMCLNQVAQILGFNDVTTGENPNPKMLVGVQDNARLATNNAIWPLADAIASLRIMSAESIKCRLRSYAMVQPYSGWLKNNLGQGVKYIQVDGSLDDWDDYVISLEEVYTDEQKQAIYELAASEIAVRKQTGKGGIEVEDWFMIEQCRNLKEAQLLLIYRKKKRQQEDAQFAQQNVDMQIQQNQVSQQTAMQALQLEYQLKAQLEQVKGKESRETAIVQAVFASEAQGKTLNHQLVMAGIQQTLKSIATMEENEHAAELAAQQATMPVQQ
jgi:hypothetical protein